MLVNVKGDGFDSPGRPYKVQFGPFLLKINAFKVKILRKRMQQAASQPTLSHGISWTLLIIYQNYT